MSLAPGTRLAPYEITTKLGEGSRRRLPRLARRRLRPLALQLAPRASFSSGGLDAFFDVSADGERFVVIEPEGEESRALIVVTDWRAQLGERGASR